MVPVRTQARDAGNRLLDGQVMLHAVAVRDRRDVLLATNLVPPQVEHRQPLRGVRPREVHRARRQLRGSPPGQGNVFQRLDDTATLFNTHCGIDLPTIARAPVWQDLRKTFARRHVLVHRDGIVDQKFLNAVPSSGLALGQRLVITRADAERALDDVEATVKALAAHP
jgi:hypothetical protein